MTEEIIKAFNDAWSRKIASENSYGKLASKEMFENKKEIIIDGVNVEGCDFYVKHCIEDCYDERVDLYEYCQMFGSECTNEKDCYYKQLQRLKQENETLREQLEIYREQYLIVGNPYEKYKQALEEIREIASNALDIIVENDELLCYVGDIYNKINEVLNEN